MVLHTEAYSEPSRISKMELFAKIFNERKMLTIFAKSFFLDARLPPNTPLTQTLLTLLYSYNARGHLTFQRLIQKPEKNVNHLNAAKKGNSKTAKKTKGIFFQQMPTRQDLICLWFNLIQFWSGNITLNQP